MLRLSALRYALASCEVAAASSSCATTSAAPISHLSSLEDRLRNVFASSSQRSYSSEPAPPVASENVQKLAADILGLTVLEASALSGILREKLGMPKPAFGSMPMMAPMMGAAAAAPAAASSPAAEPEVVKKEQTDFDVKLESYSPEGKIKVIKEIRAITSLGLKEAKEMVEKAPVVIKNLVPKAEAEELMKRIEAAGGKVSLV